MVDTILSAPPGTTGNPLHSGLIPPANDGINDSDSTNHSQADASFNGSLGHEASAGADSAAGTGGDTSVPLTDVDVQAEQSPPSPTTSENGDDTFIQMLAAFSQLPPDQQAKWRQLMGASPTEAKRAPLTIKETPTPPLVLFTEDAEAPATSLHGEHKFGIHPEVVRLAKHRQYIPLSLFLADSIRDLFLEKIPTERLAHDGSKIQVIDVSHFRDESKLDVAEWMEAWASYKRFLRQYSSDSVYLRWERHFDFLSSQADFRANFPAILRFDIRYRREYNARPFLFDQAQFLRDFQAVKDAVLREDMARMQRDLETSRSRSEMATKPSRFEPYPVAAVDGSKTRPFSRGSGRVASSSAPICLICARTGHKYPDCEEQTSEAGKPLFCKSSSRKLVSASSPTTIICVQWNLGGDNRCRREHTELHLCSFCGSRGHFACARICCKSA